MSFSLILILVGSGCLLLLHKQVTGEIYGTYTVFDHLGPNYNQPNNHSFDDSMYERSLYQASKGKSTGSNYLLPSQVNLQRKPLKSPSFMVSTSTLQLQQPHHFTSSSQSTPMQPLAPQQSSQSSSIRSPPPPPLSSHHAQTSSLSPSSSSSSFTPNSKTNTITQAQLTHQRTNKVTANYETIAPSPLPAPQYEDVLARPFPQSSFSSSPASSSSSSSSTHHPVVSSPSYDQMSTSSSNVISTVIPAPTSLAVSPTDSPGKIESSANAPAVSRVPLYVYNPSLARRLGLSTFITGSVLYGLSIIPALMAMGVTSGTGPFSSFLGSLTGSKEDRDSNHLRRRRSNPPAHSHPHLLANAYRYRELPLLDHSSTHRLLGLLVNTLELRKVKDDTCKMYYMCKVYRNAHEYATRPTLQDLESALIDTFGIAVEREAFKLDLHGTVKYFVDAAVIGLMRGDCFRSFPCETSQEEDKSRDLQFYPVTTSDFLDDSGPPYSKSKSKDINRSKGNPKWNLKAPYEN